MALNLPGTRPKPKNRAARTKTNWVNCALNDVKVMLKMADLTEK